MTAPKNRISLPRRAMGSTSSQFENDMPVNHQISEERQTFNGFSPDQVFDIALDLIANLQETAAIEVLGIFKANYNHAKKRCSLLLRRRSYIAARNSLRFIAPENLTEKDRQEYFILKAELCENHYTFLKSSVIPEKLYNNKRILLEAIFYYNKALHSEHEHRVVPLSMVLQRIRSLERDYRLDFGTPLPKNDELYSIFLDSNY